jgi:hypothetical protein
MGLNMIFQYPHLHINQTHNKSLDEINNTVSINTHGKFSQKLFSFLGPGIQTARHLA